MKKLSYQETGSTPEKLIVNMYLIVVFADNIHIIEIEFVLSISWTFNYVISRSEELQEYNHG